MINLESEGGGMDLAEDGTPPLKELAEMYRMIKDEIDEIEERVKTLKQELETTAVVLFDKMIEEGVNQIRTEFGTFSPKMKAEIAITPDKQNEAFEVLELCGLGASIKRMIHYQTLGKHYRDGDLVIPEEYKDAFKTWERKTIAMRRRNG